MRAPTVRPATLDDVDLLVAWHADPEVSRYWDGETFTVDEMRARLARPDVDSWIVQDGDDPVGYLQSWREDGEPRRGGLDGFLVPRARGRGVMPAAARSLARRLLAAGWAEVTVDPYAWNGAAVRAWGEGGLRRGLAAPARRRSHRRVGAHALRAVNRCLAPRPGTRPSCLPSFPAAQRD